MKAKAQIFAALIAAFLFLGALVGAAPPATLPANPLLQDVGIDQKLGAPVPPDIVFNDDDGRRVTVSDLLAQSGGKPIIVNLVYLRCPSLCTVVLNDTLNALRVIPQEIGDQYSVWTISFDPKEGPDLAHQKKEGYVASYLRTRPRAVNANLGWHFLTGDAGNIARFTDAVGFHFKWDQATQQYVHPAGILILTPNGKVDRYFFGVDYDPTDIRLSLVEASNGKIGTLTDKLLLFCCRYDPSTGRYTLAVTHALSIAALLTMAGLGFGVFTLWRIDRRKTRAGLRLVQALAHPAGDT